MLLNHKLILKMIHWVSMIERPNLKKGGTTIVLLSISAIKIDSLNPLSWLFGPYVKTRNKDTRIQVLHRCWWLVTTKMLQNSPDITCRFFQYQQNINKSLLSLCSISSAAMKQATKIKKNSRSFPGTRSFVFFLLGALNELQFGSVLGQFLASISSLLAASFICLYFKSNLSPDSELASFELEVSFDVGIELFDWAGVAVVDV